jgi:DNA replication protein DnaC
MLPEHRALDAALVALLRQLKLGPLCDVLPERLAQARAKAMDPADFLMVILSDEVERRRNNAASLRAAKAGLAADMVLDQWDRHTTVQYDRALLDELATLKFLGRHEHVNILGPVGVGKTMIAHGLGHIASQRRLSVAMHDSCKLFAQLKVGRVDGTHLASMRTLCSVDLLILDDFALHPLDAAATVDFAEIVKERHRKGSMIVTSNRDPSEWLSMMSEPLLAQSAVDRFANAAHDLILEGPSYRERQKPRRGKS